MRSDGGCNFATIVKRVFERESVPKYKDIKIGLPLAFIGDRYEKIDNYMALFYVHHLHRRKYTG